jgi:hypothetical protein
MSVPGCRARIRASPDGGGILPRPHLVPRAGRRTASSNEVRPKVARSVRGDGGGILPGDEGQTFLLFGIPTGDSSGRAGAARRVVHSVQRAGAIFQTIHDSTGGPRKSRHLAAARFGSVRVFPMAPTA